jgi:DNA repair exonuclease SbcCD nuclease subunit
MEIGLITDTHYNFKKGSKLYHDYFKKFYDDVFFPELEKRKIKTVVHLGDAFDNRKGTDYWSLDWAKENVYDRFNNLGITVYNIVGNHDAYFKNTNDVNSINSLLGEYSNVIRIDQPQEININGLQTLMLPWICDDNRKKTDDLLKNTKSKVVFGHLELTGFAVYPGHYQVDGMDPKVFERFDRVFSGHYHTKSTDGKIFYLGNPYQMFWNDVDDERGFHIFDTSNYDLNHIINPYKLYKKVYYEDTDHNKFEYLELKDKIVKVIVNKKTNQINFEKFIDGIINAGCIDLKIVEIVDINDQNVEILDEEGENTLDVLNKYIQDSDFDLDKNVVKNLIKEVYQEAYRIE